MSARVMLVDDHPIWLSAVERDLAAAGFDVVGAFRDGESAVRVTPALRPDVVLMDLQLPGMSGVETTAELVRFDPSIRVLMLSRPARTPTCWPRSRRVPGAISSSPPTRSSCSPR